MSSSGSIENTGHLSVSSNGLAVMGDTGRKNATTSQRHHHADGVVVRSRRGRGGGATCLLQREPSLPPDSNNGTSDGRHSNVVELELLPVSSALDAVRSLKLKPLKLLSIQHVIRMLKSAAPDLANSNIGLGLEAVSPNSVAATMSQMEPLDASTRLNAIEGCATGKLRLRVWDTDESPTKRQRRTSSISPPRQD